MIMMLEQTADPKISLQLDQPPRLSPAAALLRDGLMQRWDKFAIRLDRCHSDLSEQNVHDLRVSMRRMLAILLMCRAVMPGLKTKGLRRELKSHLDSLDELRDTQVMLLFMRRNFRRNEAAIPLITFLSLQETHLLSGIGYEIGKINGESLVEKVELLRTEMEQSLTGTGVAGQILAAVDESYAEVMWRRVNVNPENMPSVHAMRIAYKRFRYMLEVASPLVPPMPPSRPRVLQRYQGMMGDIQDMVVFLSFVDKFIGENPQFDVTIVRDLAVQKLDERMTYFLSRIHRLNRFWRKSPGVCFPWRVGTPDKMVSEQEDVEE
jgi:CHAD domain-containing protein